MENDLLDPYWHLKLQPSPESAMCGHGWLKDCDICQKRLAEAIKDHTGEESNGTHAH